MCSHSHPPKNDDDIVSPTWQPCRQGQERRRGDPLQALPPLSLRERGMKIFSRFFYEQSLFFVFYSSSSRPPPRPAPPRLPCPPPPSTSTQVSLVFALTPRHPNFAPCLGGKEKVVAFSGMGRDLPALPGEEDDDSVRPFGERGGEIGGGGEGCRGAR